MSFTREVESGTWYYSVSSNVKGQQSESDGFVEAKTMYEADEPILLEVPTPPPYSMDSFQTAESQQVGLFIAQSPPILNGIKIVKKTIWQALKVLVGKYPIAILVFPNGDVAQYYILNPAAGALCCQYVIGTARDIAGNPIDPPAHGGNYVGGGEGGGGGNYVQWIDGGYTTYSCSYIDKPDGSRQFIGCIATP